MEQSTSNQYPIERMMEVYIVVAQEKYFSVIPQVTYILRSMCIRKVVRIICRASNNFLIEGLF